MKYQITNAVLINQIIALDFPIFIKGDRSGYTAFYYLGQRDNGSTGAIQFRKVDIWERSIELKHIGFSIYDWEERPGNFPQDDLNAIKGGKHYEISGEKYGGYSLITEKEFDDYAANVMPQLKNYKP